ncbi:YciI family protein, partial [Rhizobiaceae sp. 2RAB30]
VQDGPFADTKEQLGGFFIIDVPDMDTALKWAARYPSGPQGGVEVRPNLPQTDNTRMAEIAAG